MAKRWVNFGDMPQIQRVSLVVDAEVHPELAEWIWSLPGGKGSASIRQALEIGMKQLNLQTSAPLTPVELKKKRRFITPPPVTPPAVTSTPDPGPARVPVQQIVEVPQPPHIEQEQTETHTSIKAEPQPYDAPALDAEKLAAMRQLAAMFDN